MGQDNSTKDVDDVEVVQKEEGVKVDLQDEQEEELEINGENEEIKEIFGVKVKFIDGVACLRSGNKENVTVDTSLGIWLEGGGSSVGDREEFFLKRSGGGDFVMVTHHRDYITKKVELKEGYNSYTILSIMKKEEANSDYVLDVLKNADAIWIDGGSQSFYYNWVGTNVIKGINYAVNEKRIPIGGTSAGMAVLTQFVYFALDGKPEYRKLLPTHERNPVKDFLDLPFMNNKFCDQHVFQRKRYTRILRSLATIIHRKWVENPTDLIGIGSNEGSALGVDENGIGTCYACRDESPEERAVYIYLPKCSPSYEENFEESKHENFEWSKPGVEVLRLKPGDHFDFKKRGKKDCSDCSLYEYKNGSTFVNGVLFPS